jgi:hypothetical protein
MRPLFKITVTVHSILLILDVSGAHPIARLSLFYRSSNAHQTLSWALCGSSLFLSISLGRSSIAHLSLIYRSSISLLLVLIIIESLQTSWMAPPDGSAVQALCLATFRHGRLHSSQFAFVSAGVAQQLSSGSVLSVKLLTSGFKLSCLLLTQCHSGRCRRSVRAREGGTQ